MAIIGSLAASTTTTITQSFVPELVVIATVDQANPISNLTVTIGGTVYQSLSAQARITAAMKYLVQGLLGADVKIGSILKIADGFLPTETLQLTATNADASVYTVYGFSTGRGSKKVMAGETTIQASSYETFEQFTSLLLDATNLNRVDIMFEDGHTDPFSAAELQALFVMRNTSDADGDLGSLICIDNRFGNILQAKIFTTSGGSMTVAVLNF